MKRINVFNIILQLIVILGSIVIGITVLTYIYQHEYYNKILIGLIIMSVGLMGLTEFFTLRFAIRMRSIQYAAISALEVILGLLFILLKIEMKQICIIWSIANFVISLTHIITSVINILRKPLINGVRIILNALLVIFSIILLIETIDYLNTFLIFLGIALLVEASILLIEFFISRYQN
jgi:hypothetical protein